MATGPDATPGLLLAAVAAVAAGALAGCVNLHSNVPAPQTYLLEPRLAETVMVTGSTGAIGTTGATGATIAMPAPAVRGNLQVLVPSVAPGLGTDGIAVIRPGGRFDYFLGARWAAAAPAMLQSAVIDALRSGGHFALIEPEGGPFPADTVLSLTVRHFEARYDADGGAPTIHVTLVATLGQHGARAATASVIADGEVKASDNRMQAVVAAFDEAAGEALGKVVAVVAAPGPGG